MGKSKIAITVDEKVLKAVDQYVKKTKSYTRSRFFEEAVAERVERYEKNRLARELEKLDLETEKSYAEEGVAAENEVWPEY